MMRSSIVLFLLLGMSPILLRNAAAKEPPAVDVPTALQDYVTTPDDSYGYELEGTEELPGCTVHKLALTSQTWQGIPWRHALYAYVPAKVRHEDTVLLFITGGAIGGLPDKEDMEMGARLAQVAGVPVAFLHQTPNQPLLGDRVEDDLISETFLRYLETEDATWPLLFPMVKSAVSAMTALQDFGQKKYNVNVKKFVVTGGSKRGWTTWLTAVADDRVAGIAPIVIDTLNLPAQMEHQIECWGEYSEQIADYTTKGLVDVMIKDPANPLWRWVDPYTYRSKLLLPKLIINGTNDRYWTVDAMSLYWDELIGEKYARYVPNAGHGLDDGKEGALTTLAAFTQHIAAGTSMPKLQWKFEEDDEQLRLRIGSTPTPKSVRLWVAHSGTRDFRDAVWKSTELAASAATEGNGDGGAFVGVVPKPETGYVACFGEATFEDGPIQYNLSTMLRQE
ncbi:MAG: phenylacetic acid degradation protein [Pirellulales bacterium]|nr:phenylacetic acid degradation protein [Pirellulales bacterium]